MTKPIDDFEAVRLVIEALEPFDVKERERIIRWAMEKLGMMSSAIVPPVAGSSGFAGQTGAPPPIPPAAKDIKSFVLQKNPRSDNQMAAVVAYYHRFEAPQNERKESIGKEEILEACRKSDRKRPKRPEQVLVNTFHDGLFDRAGTAGQYRLNSVGENLVAMVLPEQGPSASVGRQAVSKKPVIKKKSKSKAK